MGVHWLPRTLRVLLCPGEFEGKGKLLKDVKNTFRNVEKMLKHSRWFDDEWGVYNRGPYLQLYKSNWYNHNNSGVHFETFIEAAQLKKKAFPVLMHAEEDCPFQMEFIKRFLDLEGSRIAKWSGWSIENQGYSVLQKIVPLGVKKLENRIYEELCQLQLLAASIDQTLTTLSKEDLCPSRNIGISDETK